MTNLALQYNEETPKGIGASMQVVADHKTLPPALTFIDRPLIFIVDSQELSQYTPPSCPLLPISGFVDDQGRVHMELNSSFVPENLSLFKRIQDPLLFYKNLPQRLIESSVIRHTRRPIAGGQGWYDSKKREFFLQNVGILHRTLISDVDPEIRKRAIFLFQEGFDKLVPWLGGTRAVSPTIIPHDKMTALGWKKNGHRSLKEFLKYVKGFFPVCCLRYAHVYTKEYAS
ncbi:MAG: hypothetical protein A3I75_00390 [Deltaproteobacteria bacterium RIFCSPLOWO2_02_FULL_50_16]|nr:MAG: hypothetical protein A3B79_05585 [Deltaproteobacteria bacterium RIFCSPHIGHO2_02_FULL_50_15]OGQ58505.1 MAG: hypothetical protein A3I75_00390 [Deltaproteobacteria bacterium RIFCSPLOWO2_02_FULL_50_16]OGQ67971.1 MAG: hypothetical protein A3F89_03590 [Deltaproteobacteria bacterium RIFCSPLOWO2_12_FULL_50_11]